MPVVQALQIQTLPCAAEPAGTRSDKRVAPRLSRPFLCSLRAPSRRAATSRSAPPLSTLPSLLPSARRAPTFPHPSRNASPQRPLHPPLDAPPRAGRLPIPEPAAPVALAELPLARDGRGRRAALCAERLEAEPASRGAGEEGPRGGDGAGAGPGCATTRQPYECGALDEESGRRERGAVVGRCAD